MFGERSNVVRLVRCILLFFLFVLSGLFPAILRNSLIYSTGAQIGFLVMFVVAEVTGAWIIWEGKSIPVRLVPDFLIIGIACLVLSVLAMFLPGPEFLLGLGAMIGLCLAAFLFIGSASELICERKVRYE